VGSLVVLNHHVDDILASAFVMLGLVWLRKWHAVNPAVHLDPVVIYVARLAIMALVPRWHAPPKSG